MADCRCSNITIMQLFHQLKQRFPTVPDHVVSKVIQQNCHDKSACETILQKESHNYVQCYPGALISGEGRPAGPTGPLSDRCSLGPGPPRRSFPSNEADASAAAQPDCTQNTPDEVETPPEDSPSPITQTAQLTPEAPPRTKARHHPPTLEEKIKLSKIPLGQLIQEAQERQSERVANEEALLPTESAPSAEQRMEATSVESEASSSNQSRDPSPDWEETPSPDPPSRVLPETVTEQIRIIPQSSTPSVATQTRSSARPTTLSYDTSKGRVPHNRLLPVSSNQHGTSTRSPGTPTNRLHPPLSPNHRSTPPSGSPGTPPNRLHPSHRNSPRNCSSPGHVSHSRAPQRDVSPNALAPPSAEVIFGCAAPPRRQESPSHENCHSSQDPPQEYKVAVECVVAPSRPGDRPAAFTSVNLTLRPPTTDTPHPIPVEFSSGQSVTYTTAKIDPRQGYQSHLQIRISPTLLLRQREKKEVLARELMKEKDKLYAMRIQVRAMQTALTRCKPSPHVVNKLKADRDRLRAECQRLTAAVERYLEPPSGQHDDSFYSNLYTGQRQQRGGWSCRLCTFQNHPLLTECEQCEMPRLLGTVHPDSLNNTHHSNNNSFFVAGETSGSVSRTIPLQER